MIFQICGYTGYALAGQIRWRGDHYSACFTQPPGMQAAIRQLAKSNGNIDMTGTDITDLICHIQLYGDIRVALQEFF